jgi:hypothetical protein
MELNYTLEQLVRDYSRNSLNQSRQWYREKLGLDGFRTLRIVDHKRVVHVEQIWTEAEKRVVEEIFNDIFQRNREINQLV